MVQRNDVKTAFSLAFYETHRRFPLAQNKAALCAVRTLKINNIVPSRLLVDGIVEVMRECYVTGIRTEAAVAHRVADFVIDTLIWGDEEK